MGLIMGKLARASLEEIVNACTHGVGAVLSAAGLSVLVVFAAFTHDPWKIVGASVFGGSMLFLYIASTLYHAFPWPRVKRVMQSIDHVGIYLLIAGTYTPFLLVSLRGTWGWILFGIVWTIAVVGGVFQIFFAGRWDRLSTLSYNAMGWTIIIAVKPAFMMIPHGVLLAMIAGGLLYTAGVFFYRWERLPFHHAIWHLFVLSGTATHYFAVLHVVAARA